MVIKTTGPISLLDIQNEFGGSAPIGLNEYYGVAAGIPGSGTIGLNVFYGASAIVVWTHTITANQQELNLYNYLIAQGWNGTDEVEVTINSGVYIWSDNTAVAALNTGGAYPNGLTLINNGFIMGKGGAGANAAVTFGASAPGSSGGPAIHLTTPISINNTNGYIGGGGGGGAALATTGGGGGAGGGAGGLSTTPDGLTTPATSIPSVGQTNSQPTIAGTYTAVTYFYPTGTGAGGASGALAQDRIM